MSRVYLAFVLPSTILIYLGFSYLAWGEQALKNSLATLTDNAVILTLIGVMYISTLYLFITDEQVRNTSRMIDQRRRKR